MDEVADQAAAVHGGLNDGSMHHLLVSTDDRRRTLVMQRDEARIVVNFGTEPYAFDLLEERR